MIDDKYLMHNGSKYRKLKGRTTKPRDPKDNAKRAEYMRSYRKRRKMGDAPISDDPEVISEPTLV